MKHDTITCKARFFQIAHNSFTIKNYQENKQ